MTPTTFIGGGKVEPAVFHQGKMMRKHTRFTSEGAVEYWEEAK